MAERMDHEKMRRASELPITGPAATDTAAASGGLELPGRAAEGMTPDQRKDREEARRNPPPTVLSVEREERKREEERTREGAREPIPGEHDATTAVPTQPGAVGGSGFGGDLPVTDTDTSLSEEGRRQSRWEGGGLLPRAGPDTEAHPGERKPNEEMPGSATGTTGGGGSVAKEKTSA